MGVAGAKAISAGFEPSIETYPRVRYRPALAAESILSMWRTGFRKPMAVDNRVVCLWGLADEGASIQENSPGLVLGQALLKAGVNLRVHDPNSETVSAQLLDSWLPGATHHATAMEAADGATDLVINSTAKEYHQPNLDALRTTMSGKIVFDCVLFLDAEELQAQGFAHFPIGGHGWPPWLDPEYQEFVRMVRTETAEDARILLLPSGPLKTSSPRARWYLLLNYALAPRALLLPGPELASGTAPQYQQWVRERNRQGLLEGAVLQRAITATQADHLLWFQQAADFKPQNWRLEALQP